MVCTVGPICAVVAALYHGMYSRTTMCRVNSLTSWCKAIYTAKWFQHRGLTALCTKWHRTPHQACITPLVRAPCENGRRPHPQGSVLWRTGRRQTNTGRAAKEIQGRAQGNTKIMWRASQHLGVHSDGPCPLASHMPRRPTRI